MTREAIEDRILRVITAILQPAGFTTQWYASGRRGFEMRETFRFDTSDRMKAITGDEKTFILHIESRRTGNDAVSGSLPDACDWTLDQLVEWIQDIEAEDVAGLPEADHTLEPVRLMRLILNTAQNPGADAVKVGAAEWRAEYDRNLQASRPIILVMANGNESGKWGAEDFLLRTN